MKHIANILNHYELMITDGALASELEQYGCDLNDPLWSASVLIEQPELIKQVHLDYFKAGADCAITATYQATVEGFVKKGYTESEAKALIQQLVRLAVEARDEFWTECLDKKSRPKPLVAGSIGPYGAYLADGSEYSGQYQLTAAELSQFHRERMGLIVEAGADILACETIPNALEAEVLRDLLKEFPKMTAWVTFSAKDHWHINDGSKIADCAASLDASEQIEAIGINCTSPVFVESLIREVKKTTDKPVIVYPNSGEAYDPETKVWHETSLVDSFSHYTKVWHEAGASIIGGCCRTRPKDIANIAKWAR